MRLLNLVRWFKENLFFWGVLSITYSLTLAIVLQAILEQAFHHDLALMPVWALACVALLLPAAIEAAPLPSVTWPMYVPSALPRLARLYLTHELRRAPTWIALALALAFEHSLPARLAPLAIIVAQIPVQRALYSVRKWRGIALRALPDSGAVRLLDALLIAQSVQFAIELTQLHGHLALATWGAVLAGTSMALEADSGQPWMVNMISLAVGTLAGFLCLAQPWAFVAIAYLCHRMRITVEQRLQSVENFDEDLVVS